MHNSLPDPVDLLIVGGGINGAGIARDAAGRGLSVLLVEQGDLGGATSSASSKLIHGGLRYLETYQFRLVSEALAEREVLLRTAPHIVHSMQFVMPHVPTLRPAWMIRAGLFLYDHLARCQTLPRSHAVRLQQNRYADGLKPGPTRGFVYSDCRVDDARLVVLTARAAADAGAVISTRTRCIEAQRRGSVWRVSLELERGQRLQVAAKALANVTGPWARQFETERLGMSPRYNLKLVQGSHIVVPRLYDGDHAYILQNDDKRVIFVYGYEDRYTLIGTTEVNADGPGDCAATAVEVAYLVRAANRYCKRQISESDVVWSYCGIRPLLDDGASSASAISRDYVMRVEGDPSQPPVLSVFGGKITTYRRLAEHALEKLAPWFSDMPGTWTARRPLPGGDFDGTADAYARQLMVRYPGLSFELLRRLAQRHGTLVTRVLGDTSTAEQLGEYFGSDLYAREVDYFIREEWVRCADDVLWRRTKAGLHLNAAQQQALTRFITERVRSLCDNS
jgi:glycerol-3-phosphate dehydrogenase